MKKFLYMIIASSMLCACSEEAEQIVSAKKGVELTMSATIGKPAETRTTYTRETVGMTVDWEAEESITLVSFDETGITAIDNFTSSGEAGREKAEFTGTWNGNAGDKVICLYPALSDGYSRFFNMSVCSTSISFTYPAHCPYNRLEKLKDWDVMIGDVSISGSDASVTLNRKIAVLECQFHGAYKASPEYYYIEGIGIYATSGSTPTLFVNSGSIATTKSTYTGEIVASTYQDSYYSLFEDVKMVRDEVYTYYYPVIANGRLNAGDVLNFRRYDYFKYSSDRPIYTEDVFSKTLAAPFTITPGYVYKMGESILVGRK